MDLNTALASERDEESGGCVVLLCFDVVAVGGGLQRHFQRFWRNHPAHFHWCVNAEDTLELSFRIFGSPGIVQTIRPVSEAPPRAYIGIALVGIGPWSIVEETGIQPVFAVTAAAAVAPFSQSKKHRVE